MILLVASDDVILAQALPKTTIGDQVTSACPEVLFALQDKTIFLDAVTAIRDIEIPSTFVYRMYYYY